MPGNVPYSSYLELEKAVTHLSCGYSTSKQGYYAYNASKILGFILTTYKCCIPWNVSGDGQAVFGKTGTALIPESAKFTLSKWSDISEFATNGGKCQIFDDALANYLFNKSGVRKIVSIVKAMKLKRDNPMPKV